MIGKQICRFRISKTVLHYLTLSVRVQKSSSSASHFTISVICGPQDFDSRSDVDSWLTVRSSDDFKCSHVLHILSSLFFMLGHTSVRKPINDSAIYFLIVTVFLQKKTFLISFPTLIKPLPSHLMMFFHISIKGLIMELKTVR